MMTAPVMDPPEVIPAPAPTPLPPPPAAPPIPAELDAVLRRMRFPYLRAAAPDVLATARSQRWDPAEVVRILLEAEIKGRDEATRRNHRKMAQLPSGKTFDSWREADSSIPAPTQQALMTLEWISRAENLAVAGPSGTGKSHLAEALANKAIDQGMKVSWFTLESLTAHLGRATVDNTVSKAVAKITRCDLIVVDDIGMLPSGQAAAEAFYRVIDAAYERRSVIVTSNLHPSGFDSIMPKTLATAAVDRLLHHAHIVLTEGSSLRLTQATTGQGVHPSPPPADHYRPATVNKLRMPIGVLPVRAARSATDTPARRSAMINADRFLRASITAASAALSSATARPSTSSPVTPTIVPGAIRGTQSHTAPRDELSAHQAITCPLTQTDRCPWTP
ncbi:IS21-like element helper ATPase IstB [Streptomyces olivoreticuli]|nr:IS21-like element helper ATPase IstB [Streptomyces olivoreticuli]WKK26531.1 IS21-like element helper ATPase IstB [Streptomyces olivoreticuli]